MQGCHDLSLGWRRTDCVQYSQTGGGAANAHHHLTADESSTVAQRAHPYSTDDSPQRQTSYGIVDRGFSTRQPDDLLDLGGGLRHLTADESSTAAQRTHPCLVGDSADSPQRQTSSKLYGIVDRGPSTRQPRVGLDLGGGGDVSLHRLKADRSSAAAQPTRPCFAAVSPEQQTSSTSFRHKGPLTRQPDAALDFDLVDGVLDRTTVDGRPARPSVDGTAIFGVYATATPQRAGDKVDKRSTSTIPSRRVNFDASVTESAAYRPACSCGTLSNSMDVSPYYFRLDDSGELASPAPRSRTKLISSLNN